MNVFKNKIVSLLALKGLTSADYARFLGIRAQALQGKYNNNRYRFSDLLKLADMTNTRLAFVDKKGKVIVSFELSDLSNEQEQEQANK